MYGGDALGPPHGITPASVKANKNIKVSSLESNENCACQFDFDQFCVYFLKINIQVIILNIQTYFLISKKPYAGRGCIFVCL